MRNSGRNIESGDNVFDPTASNPRKNVDRMSLAMFIVNNYIRNGVYTVDEFETGKFINGKTVWGKTVTKLAPIIDGANIIYSRQIKKRKTTDNSNLITKLHYQIVRQCVEFLSNRGIEKQIFVPRNINVGENLKNYVSILNSELTRVYADGERALLKALISWCDISPYYKSSSGTTNYELVWEWVNNAVWGNVEFKESDAPEYRFKNDRKYAGRGEQIPDTLYIEFDETERSCRLDIFDSKYYVPSNNYNNKKIYGMPASSDISKQVGYLMFLETFMNGINAEYKEIGEQPYKVSYTNSFLIPKSETILSYTDAVVDKNKLYEVCGEVSAGTFSRLLGYFGNLSGREENVLKKFNEKEHMNVSIILVNPEILYRYYLSNPIVKARLRSD